jgi:hypothetical protein
MRFAVGPRTIIRRGNAFPRGKDIGARRAVAAGGRRWPAPRPRERVPSGRKPGNIASNPRHPGETVPRHAKSTKIRRDSSMIAGLQRRSADLPTIATVPVLVSVDAVVARLQAHLDALASVKARWIAWRLAVVAERRLEAETREIFGRLKPFLVAVYGADSAKLREFGLEPIKEPKISVETKRAAVEKRNATRKLRGTMGKKQKRAIKRRP